MSVSVDHPIDQPVSHVVGRFVDRFDWQSRAACRGIDTDIFFPVAQGSSAASAEFAAKQICATCPVVTQCRSWAREVAPEFGIFGGLTPDERRRDRSRYRGQS